MTRTPPAFRGTFTLLLTSAATVGCAGTDPEDTASNDAARQQQQPAPTDPAAPGTAEPQGEPVNGARCPDPVDCSGDAAEDPTDDALAPNGPTARLDAGSPASTTSLPHDAPATDPAGYVPGAAYPDDCDAGYPCGVRG